MEPLKPTKETLSRKYILQATLKLIDKVGLQKFTMRKLGQQMNVSPMAVYRYFSNQGALFDGLVEWIWEKALVFKTDSQHDNWQGQIILIMSGLRKNLLEHPKILPLVSTHPMVTRTEFMLIEDILRKLKAAGMEIQPTTVFLINSLTVYTLGFVWAEAVEPEHGGQINPTLMEELQAKSVLWGELLKTLQEDQFTKKQQFLMGINALLAGWK
ncbi:TetR/AcrR family transcriptional regulator [Liquorilactobacillus capillatus]|uniref:Transcriptional regulator n=1 Tax=Liquorilactobacillus capillatus DSM 19910 TaxID=1423731 RepID=A0A0R1LZP3_9LACO|nr:TetR/AcrR family transcriptional regulator [Liquorilactobacillus capillatus]KRL01149.1 transcriptional regulator [Liquorilactobacillus capillatus DSM 19910]